MKAIMLMFDSLNRRMLPPYGNDWVHAPNFQRLAERTVTFDHFYLGSAPCMPARRELHTGRYNFLHRSWGPIEPFDDSMPQILSENGVYTHLVSDHFHYWGDGGSTYHGRYNTWESIRGQEGDNWKGQLGDPEIPEHLPTRSGNQWRQDWVNRQHQSEPEKMPLAQTIALGLDFIRTNHQEDNWFLHLESFDPHEPFFTHAEHQKLYPHDYDGPHFDWPAYSPVTETPEQVEHLRYQYAASLSMCDEYLGQVLDLMDELDMWSDTLLIVNTDHGYLLGEHNWWAKNIQPFYNEVAHLPLFVWDPRSGCRGQRRTSLVQNIDMPATILEFFGIDRPRDMQGRPLRDTVANDVPVRQAGLFGIHGGHVNITDGRHTYMRAPASPDNQPLYNYTLMPSHMHSMFSLDELHSAELAPPFSFTKGCQTLKVKPDVHRDVHKYGSLLFDLESDPGQEQPLEDDDLEADMIEKLVQLMMDHDSPVEQYERLGLERLDPQEQ